ncbi:MAG: phosphotransferase [Thermodesulfobacteriota bacterium]
MEIETKVQKYLKKQFGPGVRLLGMDKLGKGLHGAGYLLRYRTPDGEKSLIMKTLFPSGFGHEHYSDRAKVLLLAHDAYNRMQKHIRSVDIVGESDEDLISVRSAREFYLFMEEARGKTYFQEMDEILERGYLIDKDKKKVHLLAQFLADIHSNTYEGQDRKILYRRRIRELIGHGECIMGVIDTYDSTEFTTDSELIDYAQKALVWWGKVRDRSERLCMVHGDFHPGNIRFQGDDFTVLDRARGIWGEGADDVSCLGINFVYYALKHRGRFEGPFEELFTLFFDQYFEKTHDRGLFEVIQPFFAFRILVIANPRFYPEDSAKIKGKLLTIGRRLLDREIFKVEDIYDLIEGS